MCSGHSGLNFAPLVTGRPAGTNLFVGPAVYLSTPSSQWHWYPEDVGTEARMDGWMDRLFICRGLKITARQCELAWVDIPRDGGSCVFIYQTPWHVLLTCLIWWTWYTEWVVFQNKTTHCWTCGKTQHKSFYFSRDVKLTHWLFITYSSFLFYWLWVFLSMHCPAPVWTLVGSRWWIPVVVAETDTQEILSSILG